MTCSHAKTYSFDLDAVQYAMCILAKLGADSAVTQRDLEVQVALQRAFTALSEHLNEVAACHLVVSPVSRLSMRENSILN